MRSKRVNISNNPQSNSVQPPPPAQEQMEKLEKAADITNTILLKIKTIFPFQIFPDDIIIDTNKVNIIRRDFFLHERIHSVFIKDITDVLAKLGPITATLEVVDQGFTENSIQIKHLKKSEAVKARRIIQGLVVAHKNEIDLSQIEDQDKMIENLEKLGETKRT